MSSLVPPHGATSLKPLLLPEAERAGERKRAEKLKEEPDYENPPSDGYQTGLAVVVLREAGVSADDPVRRKLEKESENFWLTSWLRNADPAPPPRADVVTLRARAGGDDLAQGAGAAGAEGSSAAR